MDTLEDLILGQDDPEREELERNLPCDGPMVRTWYENRTSSIRLLGEAVLIVLGMPFILLWILYQLIVKDFILYKVKLFLEAVREIREQAEYFRNQERKYLEWEEGYYRRVELGVVPPPADGSTWKSMRQKREAEKREKSKFIVSTILILIMLVAVQIIGVIVC